MHGSTPQRLEATWSHRKNGPASAAMPLITVIMPARDAATTLVPAVTSVLRALPQDSELAIMDDGSQIPVEESLSRVNDRRIRILRHHRSTGVGASLQELLEATDSRFVARMDADDITLPWRFRHQLPAFEGRADFVFSPIVLFRTRPPSIRPSLPLPISADAMPMHLLIHNPLSHPTMTAFRDALAVAGGYRSVGAEDHDLWLRALSTGQRIVRTAFPSLAYRQHDDQVSSRGGFIKEAHTDPKLRAAYAEFVQRRFGTEPTWLDSLWSGRSGDQDVIAGLEPLCHLADRRAANLSPLQRRVWQRTRRLLDERMRPHEPS